MRKKLDLNMVKIEMIHLLMIMNLLLDIRSFYHFNYIMILYLTMSGENSLIQTGINDLNYGYLMDGSLLISIKINKPMYWIDQKYKFCLTGIEKLITINLYPTLVTMRLMLFVDLRKRECQQNLKWNFFKKK